MPILKQNNKAICYETFGNAKNPCVILIMGTVGQLIAWPKSITQGLVDLGYYVITFDNRDVGLSSYYDHLPTPSLAETMAAMQQGQKITVPYTTCDMAEDVLDLIQGLHIDKAHIVGISMGGEIAQIFALNHPMYTLSLTCIGSSSRDSDLPPPKPEVMNLFFGPKPIITDAESYINSRMQSYLVYNHPEDINEPEARELYRQEYQRAYHPEGSQRQLLAMIFVEPRGERLKQLAIPSLVIHGDNDPAIPLECGKHLAACLPRSHLLIIKNMGHGLPEKACAEMVVAMDQLFTKKL